MAERDPGWEWQGEQYNAPLSPAVTHSLAGAIRRANAESPEHPGLYWSRFDDIPSVQLDLRPVSFPVEGIDLNALLDAEGT